MNDKVKKYVLPNLPYLFIFWLADKLGQAFRLSAGENMGKRLQGLRVYRHYGGSPQSALYRQAEGQPHNEGAYP